MRDAAGEIAGYLHLKDVLYADDERHEQPIPPKRVRRLATVREDDEVEDVLADDAADRARTSRASSTTSGA